jgi:HEAT repeat protein
MTDFGAMTRPRHGDDGGQLLSDEEMRRFIVDGYLVLQSGVPPAVHDAVYRKLQWILHEEGNPGNNILPAVPEMQLVLDSPRIKGALASVLGPGYVLHPHRFVHNIEPADRTAPEPQVGKGSASFVGWHQDSHSPLARPRHHYARYAMILYYPQDTPVEMGPTQLIPCTQLNRSITEADRARGFQAAGPAGTCVLVHFDIAHGGSINVADRTRHMAKFVFARTEEPTAPAWDCREAAWRAPDGHHAPADSTVVWKHIWSWATGRAHGGSGAQEATAARELPSLLAGLDAVPASARIAAVQSLAALGEAAAPAIPALMACLGAEEPLRRNALYGLAAIGGPAVAPLAADLARRTESGWNEGAYSPEDSAYALAAIGEPAVAALTGLLDSEHEWVRINALFALGEMGSAARPARAKIVAALCDRSHRVVRTALDALGQIGGDAGPLLPELRRLLLGTNPGWQEPLHRSWTGENQVRVNAMMALLRLGAADPEAIDLVIAALSDPCGYVGGFGVELLLRAATPASLAAAIAYLRTRRWDDSLHRGIHTY